MLQTFHGDKKIKTKYLNRVKAHYKADEIIQGTYWKNGNGCAVGCTIEGSDHNKYETELGIPKEVAYLEDIIFEELKNGDAKEFPVQFLKAVGVGKDLSKVVPQIVIWQFEDKKHGLKHIKEVKEDKEIYGLCEKVVALYKRELKGDKPTEDEYYELYLKIDKAEARAWAWAWAWAWTEAWAGAEAAAAATRARAWAWARAAAAATRARAWAKELTWAWAWAWARADERILALRDYFLKVIKEAPDAR